MIVRGVKQKIADVFFGKELDEAYEMGIREGSRYTMSRLYTKMYAKRSVIEMTKTQEIGYNKAIDAVREGKHEIRGKIGAWS